MFRVFIVEEVIALQLFKAETHGTTKAFYLSSAVWMVLGTLAGFIDATHMAAPELLGNIPWIVFGRVRPMHTNAVIFGFVGSALWGHPTIWFRRCCAHRFTANGWAKLSLWLWNLAVIAGTITLAWGIHSPESMRNGSGPLTWGSCSHSP